MRKLAALSIAIIVLAPMLLIAPPLFAQLSPSDLDAAKAAMNTIRPEAIRADMRFFSDPLLQGRGTGTPGYDIAAHYVQAQFEAMGLTPCGIDGTWYQPVPLRKAVLDAAKTAVTLTINGKEETLVGGKDYVIDGNVLRTDSDADGDVVFVGFGITSPEENYDDYAGADVKGKIVAAIDGAPPKFSSTIRAYYSDGINKARIAVAHGAIGYVSIFLPEDWKRYPWDWLVPQIESGSMDWLAKDGTPHNTFPQLRAGALLNQDAAEKLFSASPKTLDQTFAAAQQSQPQSFPLNVRVHIHTASVHTPIQSSNIIALLKGSDPKLRDQYVVYTAHVDHLGICPAINGDDVCHGTLDNASGASSILEIARAYSRLPHPPRRSMIFAIVTGEEMGLLGSDYFAHFPTVPLESIVANVNIDGTPGLLYPMQDVVPLGSEHSDLGRDLDWSAAHMGYKVSPDPMPEEVQFIRSDQYSFVLQGVPAVQIEDGVHSTDPNVNGFEVIKKWLTTNYHTPLDSMDQPLNFDSGARATRLNFLLGYDIAQQDAVPAWNKGDFFGEKYSSRHKGGFAAED